jgi:hypothetical protein
MIVRTLPVAALLFLAACGRTPETPPPAPPAATTPAISAPVPAAPLAPVEPPAPGTPGGLPDDRTPISEGPFTPQSAQGAADVVQTYFALLGEAKYGEAWRLWSDGGKASGQPDGAAFARSFDRYAQYNAQVGAPGVPEGAAGSSYVSVPVVIYGRLKTGQEVHEKGEAQLRRVNDVPGATAEQLKWRIFRIETQPTR